MTRSDRWADADSIGRQIVTIRSIRALALFSGLLLIPAPVRAQFQPCQAANPQAGPTAQLVVNQNAGYVPYGAYGNGYGSPYGYNGVYGGYLTGAANLGNAAGEYRNQIQQSRITQNQADEGRLDVRKKVWEQDAWERQHMPTTESVRAYEAKIDLQRSRNNPPSNFIWSGDAMNTLALDIVALKNANIIGPSVPVDPSILSKIGVTDGTISGDYALLLNDGKLRWPFVLTKSTFATGRKKIDELLPKA